MSDAKHPPVGARRYSIGYAYATSTNAKKLGHGRTGCYYIEVETMLETSQWSQPKIAPGFEREATPDEAHLRIKQLVGELQSSAGTAWR